MTQFHYQLSATTLRTLSPVPLLILIISLLLTIWGWYVVKTNTVRANQEQFELRTERLKFAIQSRVIAYENVLRAGDALFAAVPVVTRKDWHEYVDNLRTQDYFPGIKAIGFSKRVLAGEEANHIQQLRDEGFLEYKIHPAGERQEYLPLIYLEPWHSTYQELLGFDALTDPIRRAAVEHARDTGKATITNQVTLLMDAKIPRPGVVIYLPVYRQGAALNTVAERRANLLGFVSGGFFIDEIMQSIFGNTVRLDIDFHIYDGSQVSPEQLLYNDPSENDNLPGYQPQFVKVEQLTVAEHIWTLRYLTLPKFDTSLHNQSATVILSAGLFVSILLFSLTWSLTVMRQINSNLKLGIEQRKRIENRLKSQEELLRLVIDSIPQYIFWKDLNSIYLGCNRRFALIAGVENPSQMVGKTDFDLPWKPEDSYLLRAIDKRVIETDTPEYHIIEAVTGKEGEQVWLDSSRIPLHDDCGEVMGILVTFEDITLPKQAELALRRSQEALQQANLELNQFKTTLDLTNEGVVIRDGASLQLTYLNQGLCKMLGYSQQELTTSIKMIPTSINPEMDEVSFRQLMVELRHNPSKSKTFQSLYRRKNGSLLPVEVSLQYIQVPGQTSRYIAMVRDITERKQAEESLQQAIAAAERARGEVEQANLQLQQFKTTLDMTLDIVLIRDVETFKFTYANQGAVNHLGYSLTELLQMTPLDLHPELTLMSLEELQMPLLQGNQLAVTFESNYRHQNGTMIPVEISLQYVQVPGQLNRFISIARDITERKQAEAELLQAKEKAEIANRAKSSFLANMSHELRTPLNGILGYAQILTRDRTLSEKQREGVQIIERSGDYLLTLINDILDLSKIEAGRVELSQVDFHLEDFLQGITDLFKMRAQQKHIAFVYEQLSPLPLGVRGDEKRLRQILINLIGNAVKFTETGGVTLKIDYHQGKLRFQVEDTGVGIAEADLEKVFLPFQQVGDPSYRAEGTGLGLSITKKLVQMMGGKLQVHSQFGHGSTFEFTITLPESTVVKPTHEEQSLIVGYEGHQRTILIMDDKWENRSVLVSLLGDLGFRVIEASNGQEGLDKLLAESPVDLILTDLVMPVMDGFEATRRLRAMPAFQKIPVVAASASVFEMDQQQSLEAGCNAFLPKPIRVEALLDCLQRWLELHWVYEAAITLPATLNSSAAVNSNSGQSESSLAEANQLAIPSPEQLNMLLELAMMGDIGGIVESVEELEQSSPELRPFTQKLRQLAKNFEEHQIRELLQQYMQDMQAS